MDAIYIYKTAHLTLAHMLIHAQVAGKFVPSHGCSGGGWGGGGGRTQVERVGLLAEPK
jgi:hypothetical protein